jgi:hypothetical protein
MQPAGSGAIDEWYILGCQMVKGCELIEMRPDGRNEKRSSLRPDGREMSVNGSVFSRLRPHMSQLPRRRQLERE